MRFSPGSSSVVYLGASSLGVMKSTDGGDTFLPSSVGIGAMNVFSIASNPFNQDEMAIAFQGQIEFVFGIFQTSLGKHLEHG